MRTLLPVIVVISVPASSYADHPKYTRTQDLKFDVKSSVRVKPISPTTTIQHRPALTANEFLSIEELVDPIRLEQEALLVKLVSDTPDSDPDKPDYLFRLAEHYAMQHRLWHLKAVGATLSPVKRVP